ncbi:MAG: retroviral-like aspartic protease family protein [Mediterranea sp.]|jgi:predicted aspartyl protease|nr:retroviral-like aspartic protease family protein [Mediterranea sp.]
MFKQYIKFVVVIAFLPISVYCQINNNNIQPILKVLSEGLRNKDMKLVRKTFAEDISISAEMGVGTNNLLETILEHVDFESVELSPGPIQTGKDTIYVNVRFILQQGKPQESIIAFDSENKILFIDYFDRLFGQSRYRKSSLAAVIPFKQEGQSIILAVKLNNSDRLLSFLLDTGADGMAIKKSLADSLDIKPNYTQNANIVGGRTQVSISSGNTVYLTDSLSLTGQNMAIFDKIRNNLDGIIGLNLIKRYITRIDFDDQKIYLYSFGDYHYAGNDVMVPVRMHRALIVVPSELGITETQSVMGNFLFDTGANYSLIAFSNFVREKQLLQTGFKPESIGTTVSLGHSTPVCHGKAYELRIGNIIKNNIPVTLQASALNSPSHDNGIDGSIGIQFWSMYNLTVDLLRKEIHLTPRE